MARPGPAAIVSPLEDGVILLALAADGETGSLIQEVNRDEQPCRSGIQPNRPIQARLAG
ncbi:MAG: hypothetical protein IH987_19145 [Planctomycetes bacterium]|nr:hypothetical protein [Planctomycetota bacterium]